MRASLRIVVLLLVSLPLGPVICAFAQAQTPEAQNLVRNGDFAQGLEGWRLGKGADNGAAHSTSAVVDAQAGPFPRALRVTVTPQPKDNAWVVELHRNLDAALFYRDRLVLKVWMRSPDRNKVTVLLQESSAPYEASLDRVLELSPEWKEYSIEGESLRNFAPGEAQLTMYLAHQPGIVEIAGIRLFTLPPQPHLDISAGHSTPVISVAFSPDGQVLATGGMDGMVKLWEVRTGSLLQNLRTTAYGINALAFSPDGKLLAAGTLLGRVLVWDAQTGISRKTIAGHASSVSSVAFSPDGGLLASGSDDKTIKLWDASTGVLRQTLTGHTGGVTSVAFSSDGKTLASGGYDKAVRLWDVPSGTLQRTIGGTQAVLAVAWTPRSHTLLSSSEDAKVCLWDAGSGALERTLTGFPHALQSLAISADERLLAGAPASIPILVRLHGADPQMYVPDTHVYLWDMQAGTMLPALKADTASATAVAFAPDSKTLATAGMDKTARLWDVATRQQLNTFGSTTFMAALSFAPDGGTLVAGTSSSNVLLWDVHTGALKQVYRNVGMWSGVTYSPDGQSLAVLGDYGTIRLLQAQTGAVRSTLPGSGGLMQPVVFTPDGKRLVSESIDIASAEAARTLIGQATIKVWDSQTGVVERTLTGPASWRQPWGNSLAISPDSRLLAGDGGAKTIKVWDLQTGATEAVLKDQQAPADMTSVAFAPDGQTLVAACADNMLRFWDMHSGALARKLGGSFYLTGVTFSPDGRFVIGTGYPEVEVWDAASGSLVRSLNSGLFNTTFAASFLPHTNILACAGMDQGIRLWDIAAGRLVATFYALPPSSAARPLTADSRPLGADARALAADARALTADARPAVEHVVSEHQYEANSIPDYLALTAAGYYMGSAAADRYVRFRLRNLAFPAECFQAVYYRPDLVRQVLAGQPVPAIGNLKGPFPPQVSFVPAADGGRVTGDTATVTVQASDDSAVEKVDFFVNGTRVEARPITADSRPAGAAVSTTRPTTTAAYQVTRSFTVSIPLPADTETVKVQAIAFDDDGLQSERAEITLVHTQVANVAGKLLGLCVGVSQYQDPRLNLHYADADATALAQALNQQHGIYSSAQVETLTNEQATRRNIIAALDTLIAQTTRRDTVMLLLSGHGWRSDERSFYFASYEVNRNDVANTSLPWKEVIDRLTQLSQKSKRVIVLLDACHSGSAATNEELVKAVLGANAGVMVLASSKGNEVSLENAQWEHGAFTKAILEGLDSKAAPQSKKGMSLRKFMNYVQDRVSELTEDAQHPQVPFLQDFDTDAAIIARL